MKKILKNVSFLCLGVLIFTSCSDDKVAELPSKTVSKIELQPEKGEEFHADTLVEMLEKDVQKTVPPPPPPRPVPPSPMPPEPDVVVGGIYKQPPNRNLIPPPPPPFFRASKVDPGEEIFISTTLDPEFPGGTQAMKKFLNDNLVYPEIDQELGNQGIVYVQFVIEKDGSISSVEVARGISNTLDQEAVRIISAMPKWKPGESDGEPVRCKLRYPIIFTLQ